VCTASGAPLGAVAGESDRTAAARAPRPLGLTPFVNRTGERQLLHSRFEQALDGEGQVGLLAGEPGIGKSRLVHAFREDIADTPHTWLALRPLPPARARAIGERVVGHPDHPVLLHIAARGPREIGYDSTRRSVHSAMRHLNPPRSEA